MSKGGEREERVIALYKHLRTLTLLLYSSCILYYLTTGWEGARKFMVLMIPLSIVLWVADSLSRGERLIPKIKNIYVNSAIGLTFIFIALASWYYLNANFWDLVSIRMGFYTDIDLIVGGLLSLLVLWYGALKYPIIFVIVVFFIIHVLYGRFFPGILYHPGISFQRMVAAFSVDFSTGIFESLPQIGATIISAFMLLVGIINGFGVVRSINNIVVAKLHKRPELIPQSNILVGTPIGMVTGSAGAATATVGSVTVPLIKSLGITLPAAAAMAAASGIGAQLMPPVMGASAFIMADALGVSYFDVMIRGFIPALVYFGGISVAMFYLTLRSVKKSTSKLNVSSGRPGNESSLISSKAYRLDYVNTAIFAMGIGFLVILMAYWVYAPIAALRAALFVLGLLVITKAVYNFGRAKRETSIKLTTSEVIGSLWKSLNFFAVETCNITLLLSFLALLKVLLTITGLSFKVGFAIVSASGGNVYLAALLTYLFGYLLGTGIPPAGTYVIMFPIVVPALMRLGVPAWAAHFATFFAGVHAEFAPPMSVSAATISRVAQVPYTSVLKELVKMGIGLPILILVTPIKPELVIQPGINQIISGLVIGLGIIGLESVAYWDLHRSKPINLLLKCILATGSVMTIFTKGFYELLGLLITSPLVIYSLITAFRTYRSTGK